MSSDAFTQITFGADGAQGHFLYAPSGSSAAVIVLQEWWGVNETIKTHARKLRDDIGVAVLVPDLYRGSVGVDVEEAHHLMSNLDWTLATKEIGEAAEELRKRGANKVGVIGFCMGGALTLIAGEKAPVDAIAPFYGYNADACDASAIAIPVQGHFGEKDNLTGFSDPETAKQLKEKLTRENQEIFTYPDVGHAFMNSVPDPYPDFESRERVQGFPPLNEATVALAWGRVEAFFRTHLL